MGDRSGIDASEVESGSEADADGWLPDWEMPDISAHLSSKKTTISEPNYLDSIRAGLAYLAVLAITPFAALIGVLPTSWRLYRKVARWSIYRMQRAAGADTVANVRLQSGKEDLRPAKWVPGAEDEKDRSGWKVKGVEGRFDPSVHGKDSHRMGKADIIHLDSDETEVGTWAETTMDNALQFDRERYLFRDAVVQAVFDVGSAPQPNTPTRADGGLNMDKLDQFAYEITVQRPGIHEETIVPINSREGYDGQAISWTQYQSMKEERSDQETVRDAKNQAWAAAKLDDIEGRDIFKWALLLGAAGAVLLFHQEIGAFIAGLAGSGGGGGSVGAAVSGGLGYMTVGADLATSLGVM